MAVSISSGWSRRRRRRSRCGWLARRGWLAPKPSLLLLLLLQRLLRVLRRVFRAWLVTGKLLCRGRLRLVMVALRSRVTRSLRLVAARKPAQRRPFPARSLGSRTALPTRSLRRQPMLVVIRRRPWLRRRLRQARRPALTAARSAWSVTLVLVAARSSTSLVVQRLCLVRRVVWVVVIWRLRRLIGTVPRVPAIQAVRGVAAVGRRRRAVLRALPALLAPVLVLVLRILSRLWLAAPALIR